MTKQLFLILFLITGYTTGAQLYKKPVYPQNYFRWPTNLTPDIVANMGELRSNHWHMGLDVRTLAKVNQNIYAAADGYISFVGIKPLSFGRWIVITHPNGLSTLYAHLNAFEPQLEAYVTEHQYQNESWETALEIPKGKFPVKKGDFIAYSGTTGGSQGPHLHWEILDTRSDKRLNPTLFVSHIADNIAPTVVRMALYDRSNSVWDQTPTLFKLQKKGGTYAVQGDTIRTNYTALSFAIQAYDTRNGTTNQDGIYSARLFVDEAEVSSFYIDSIDYNDTRYMNCHVDYKMKATGGAWMQHTSQLAGDRSGIYYDLGTRAIIPLQDTSSHTVSILVSDANNNSTSIQFVVKNNGAKPPAIRPYEWQPNQMNRLFKYDFEAYLPLYALYDKMNSGYVRLAATTSQSVSAAHKLGENYIPVHSYYEVRIKPDRTIAPADKDRIVIKRSGSNKEVKKATWQDGWMTAQFRDFGTFEAFIDNVPPSINNLGSGAIVNLTKASRIVFTPTDNFGIATFRATVNGKWLRFTNDKGRNWIYNFDSRIDTGIHTLVVTVTDIAGNQTTRSWKFSRGITHTLPATEAPAQYKGEGEDEEGTPTVKEQKTKPAITPKAKKESAQKSSTKSKTTPVKKR